MHKLLKGVENKKQSDDCKSWLERHHKTLDSLETITKQANIQLRLKWEKEVQLLNDRRKKKFEALEERHKMEKIVAMKELKRRQKRLSGMKLSPHILNLLGKEKVLVKARHYEEAANIRFKIDELVEQEVEKNVAQANNKIFSRIDRLDRRHELEKSTFAYKTTLENSKLKSERDKQIQKQRIKFDTARSSLKHAIELQTKVLAGSSPLRNQILNTSKKGEVQAAQACLSVTKLLKSPESISKIKTLKQGITSRPKSRGRGSSPISRGSSRGRGSSPISRGSSRGRPVSRGSSRPISRGSSQERPMSRGSSRNRLPQMERACDWCGRLTKLEDAKSIPNEMAKNSCGFFCSWECAMGWNKKFSPVQIRYERELIICGLANRVVHPRPYRGQQNLKKVWF